MKKCLRCSAELADSATECTACSLSIEDTTDETAVLPADPHANTPTRLENPSKRNKTLTTTTGGSGRFVSGTILAGRYRIAGLIGKGGMGEVYKADDLELDQTVALKFLPEELSKNEELLRRFRGEVRNARQVSHRNVCRVFDIGEIEGLYYLTMEYIDGDDLSMLLRRIGRLPSDKAVEISRDISMGLAAIHKAGILHRDLKPANIIIDSNGEARITDFGIAGIEAEVQGNESKVGTPAYMSPEQIDGREVTQRSDIYSLGLLLYEIFTGKQAFEGESVQELQIKQATTSPRNPSEIVSGLDPIVENVIKRCLQKDPNDRPESALKVAMSLPGGDPLQMALEAGQTPSPEMVAAAPKVGTLRPLVALTLALIVFSAFGLLIGLSTRRALQHAVPLDKAPDVLSERGRELAENFGYPPVDSYQRFYVFTSYLDHIKENDQTQERWKKLESAQPAILQFLYRTSPEPIVPVAGGEPTLYDPPNNVPGMTRIRLDTKGRLVSFEGVPSRVMDTSGPRREFDWGGLFKEAGLDLTSFQSTDPQWTPPQVYDDQRAFSGIYPGVPDIPIRIEAATLRGKLVSFAIVEPWTPPPGKTPGPDGLLGPIIAISFFLVMLSGSAWLAIRNVRAGRSDLKNAFRVALLLFGLRMIIWLFSTHHVASLFEYRLLETAFAYALTWSVTGGLVYLAFEPYLRKVAPERVIAWNRLLTGDWRDPLVGRDVLIGAAGVSLTLIVGLVLTYFIPKWLGEPPSIGWDNPAYLGGIDIFPGFLANSISWSLFLSFGISFFMLFLGLLLRRKWLAAAAVWLLLAVPAIAVNSEATSLELIDGLFQISMAVLIAARFGVLASLSFFFLSYAGQIPFAADLTVWYAGNFMLVIVIVMGLTAYGFYTSIAGARLFGEKSLLGE